MLEKKLYIETIISLYSIFLRIKQFFYLSFMLFYLLTTFFHKYIFCGIFGLRNRYDTKSIEEKRRYFSENFYKYEKNFSFKSDFIKFYTMIGDYDEVINKIGSTNSSILKTFSEYKRILESGNEDDLKKLRIVSQYSKTLMMKLLKIRIGNYDFNRYCYEIETLLKLCDNDQEVTMLCAQYLFLCFSFKKGMELLNSIGKKDVSSAFLSTYNKFKEIREEKTLFYRINHLKSYYELLNKKCSSDSFEPSIYYSLKIFVLKEYVVAAVEYKKKDVYEHAKELYENKKDDYSCYYYIMSYLLNEKPNEAHRIYLHHPWKDSVYKLASSKKLKL